MQLARCRAVGARSCAACLPCRWESCLRSPLQHLKMAVSSEVGGLPVIVVGGSERGVAAATAPPQYAAAATWMYCLLVMLVAASEASCAHSA
eukprot:scaffold70910_cov69-Phaeocystis_antarctica.AAC.1